MSRLATEALGLDGWHSARISTGVCARQLTNALRFLLFCTQIVCEIATFQNPYHTMPLGPPFFSQSFSLPVASVFERVEDESRVMCLHLFSRWPCFYLFPAFSGRWVQSQLPSLDSECMLLVAQLLHSSLCTCLRGSDGFFGRSLLVPSDKRRSVHNSFGILSRIMITQFCTHFECAILDAF